MSGKKEKQKDKKKGHKHGGNGALAAPLVSPVALQAAPSQDGADPDAKLGRKQFEKELGRLQIELVKLQEWVKANGAKVCVIFEGRDAAGKGGIIKRLTDHPGQVLARRDHGRSDRALRRAHQRLSQDLEAESDGPRKPSALV